MSGKSILVTGGAGFIGSACSHFLQEKGHRILVLDNLDGGREEAVNGTLFVGDIRDPIATDSVFKSNKIDAVLHFAAKIQPSESIKDPVLYYDINTAGLINVVRSMLKFDVDKLIFSSSASVYAHKSSKLKEEDSCRPSTPYGNSKWLAEQFLSSMKTHGKLSVTNLRYFNAAGAIPELEIGESHEKEIHLIPIVIDAAMKNTSFTVFGSDYPTTDGTCVRDYVHVKDLASAHCIALDKLLSGESGSTYNVGSGIGHTVLQVVREIEKQMGTKIKIDFGDRRPGDPATLVTNNQRISQELKWSPIHSKLTEMIKDGIRWAHKKNQ